VASAVAGNTESKTVSNSSAVSWWQFGLKSTHPTETQTIDALAESALVIAFFVLALALLVVGGGMMGSESIVGIN
jgi:hypothetical protein